MKEIAAVTLRLSKREARPSLVTEFDEVHYAMVLGLQR